MDAVVRYDLAAEIPSRWEPHRGGVTEMPTDNATLRTSPPSDLTEALIRVGLIGLLAVLCVRVLAPFFNLIAWAVILAVAIYPLHLWVAERFGGRQSAAAAVLTVATLLLLGVPTVMLGSSFASQARSIYATVESDGLRIEPPDPGVAEWPVIGEPVFRAWSAAAADLPAFVRENREQVTSLSQRVLYAAASTAGSVLMFLGAVIIAAIVNVYGESGSRAVRRIFCRVSDPIRGPKLQVLSTATVRSVAAGVVGVAFIQALLLGVGFMIAGIPGAGVLALIVMFIGILQLPAFIVSLPAIVYLWWSGDNSATANIFYTVFLLVAGMADNVLKPLLLGRGVDAPMPVILIGALGGMVTGGVIGLFLGAVLLAVGYQLFMEWVDSVEEGGGSEPGRIPAAHPAGQP
jgi:predicted PurR-regulated permease PerM